MWVPRLRHDMKKALIANYAGGVAVATSQVIAIPFYLDYLGPNGWGMVSAILTWSAAAPLVESGFTLSVCRNVALFTQQMDLLRYLRSIERRYLLTSAMCLVVALALLATLDAEKGQSSMIPYAILLMAALVSGAPYRAVLVGVGAQVKLNIILGTFALVRHAVAVICAYVYGTFAAVVVGMAAAMALETGVRRVFSARVARSRRCAGISSAAPPVASWPYQLVVASIVGGLLPMLDRTFMSAMLEAAEFGAYSVAALLSISALQLAYPVSQALIPRLRDFAGADSLHVQGRLLTRMVVAALVGLLAAGTIGDSVLMWWLGDDDLVRSIFPLFIIHLAGTALNILCIPFHLGMLACGGDRQILNVNILAVCAEVAVLVVLFAQLGATAGAVSWIAANAMLLLGYLVARVRVK